MIESDWKKHRHHKQQHQHTLVGNAHDQEKEEADQQDHQFRDDDVRQNCPDEETVLTFEERETVWAVMPYPKRLREDLRLTTGGAE